MLVRLLVYLALALAPDPAANRDPLDGLHNAPVRFGDACLDGADPKACEKLEAHSRVTDIYAAIEAHIDRPVRGPIELPDLSDEVGVVAADDVPARDPGLVDELKRICARESWCSRYRRQSSHPRDRWSGERFHKGAVRRGRLHPDECPEHKLDPAEQWAPGGNFGVSPALFVGDLGECVGTELVGDPNFDTRGVLAWIDRLDRKRLAQNCPARARRWAGPGRWDKRSHTYNLRKAVRACGEPHPIAWVNAVLVDTFHPRPGQFRKDLSRAYKAWQ